MKTLFLQKLFSLVWYSRMFLSSLMCTNTPGVQMSVRESLLSCELICMNFKNLLHTNKRTNKQTHTHTHTPLYVYRLGLPYYSITIILGNFNRLGGTVIGSLGTK